MDHLALGDPAREDHGVHGELLQPEMGVEEVHREDEARGQQRLVGVDDEGNIDHPARHEAAEEFREPHDQAGEPDGCHAPENGQIIELLEVGPTIEFRLGALSEEPLVVVHEVLHVLLGGNHGIGVGHGHPNAAEAELAAFGIADEAAVLPEIGSRGCEVEREIEEGDDRAEMMQSAGDLWAA